MFENAPHEQPACNLCGETSLLQVRKPNFVQCRACRLRFYSPRPTWQALIDTIWHPGNVQGLRTEALSMFEKGVMWGDPPGGAEAQFAFLRSYYGDMISTIRNFRPELNSMFEVGGSIGRFLQIARDDFGVAVCDGCEINAEAVRIAQEKLHLRGMAAGDFLSYRPNRDYDCIVAFDYIEHTYHPNEDFRKINSMLRPGGVLALKTFIEELDAGGSMIDYPWHSHHFFGDVLYRMITQNGFSIVHWEIHAGCQVFLVARKHEIPAYYSHPAADIA